MSQREERLWRPPGKIVWAARLPLQSLRFRSFASTKFIRACDRFCVPLPLPADRYDGKFVFSVVGVLAFTLLAYWSLTDYWDVQWYAGGRWSKRMVVGGRLPGSAMMAAGTGRLLTRLGHPRLGWSTPEGLSRVNEQGETTLHNISSFSRVFPTVFFWGSTIALVGAVARVVLHHHRRVTNADFILPSLILSPALLMIMFWIVGGQSIPGNVPRIVLTHFGLSPVGSEIPEVLMGLCLVMYSYANCKRAVLLRGQGFPLATGGRGGKWLFLRKPR